MPRLGSVVLSSRLAIALLLAAINYGALAAPHVVLRGKILLPDGTPGAGTAIRADVYEVSPTTGWSEKGAGPVTTAAADGSYELHIHQTRMSRVTIEREGYASGMITFYRFGSNEVTREHPLDIQLQPEAVVRGTVFGSEGQALAEAEVGGMARRTKIHQGQPEVIPAVSKAKTNPDGTFELRGLPAEEIEVFVTHKDFVPASTTIRAPADGVRVQLAGGGSTIAGRVLRYGTREPVTSASLLLSSAEWDPQAPYVEERTLTSAADATFRADHLPAGKYRLSARAPLSGLTEALGVPALRLAEGESTNGLEILMHPGHTLTGQVIDAVTKLPLEGVELSHSRNDIWTSTTTDRDGRYKLTQVEAAGPRGGIALQVKKPGYLYDPDSRGLGGRSVFFTGVSLDQLDVQRNLELTPSQAVQGTIRNGDGNPVPNAEIRLLADNSNSFPVWTDSAGRYVLHSIAGRKMCVSARLGEALTVSSEPFVLDSSTETIDLVLAPTASIVGLITDENGTSVTGAQIRGFDRYATTDDGNFRLAGIKPKTDWVTIRAKGFLVARAGPFTLAPGQTVKGVSIVLRRGKPLGGRVIDPDGRPLQGATIYCPPTNFEPGNATATAFTDEQGRFHIDACETTEGIRLDYEGSTLRFPEVVAGREDLELVFSAWSDVVVDFIDDETSEPVTYAEVEINGRKMRADHGSGVVRLRIPTPRHNHLHATATAPGYVANLQFMEADRSTRNFRHTFRMGRGAMLRGEVVRATDNLPLGNVIVTVNGGEFAPTDLSVRASPTGKFELGPLRPGKYAVTAIPAKPMVPKTQQVELAHRQDQVVTLKVDRGITIAGRLVHEDGHALAGETIEIVPIGYDPNAKAEQVVLTSSDGSFVAPGLQEGWRVVRVPKYNLRANGDFSKPASGLNFRVGTGRLELTLDGAPGKAFEATLKKEPEQVHDRSESFNALPVYPPAVTIASTATGMTGSPLVFSNLAEGSYVLEVGRPANTGATTSVHITIQRGQTLKHQLKLKEPWQQFPGVTGLIN